MEGGEGGDVGEKGWNLTYIQRNRTPSDRATPKVSQEEWEGRGR